MLELHTRQVDTVDTTTIKRSKKNEKEQLRGDKVEVPPWDNVASDQGLHCLLTGFSFKQNKNNKIDLNPLQ